MKVLMISGDVGVIKNLDGPFALTLRELSRHWDKIDVLCPGLKGYERQFNQNVRLIGVRKFLLFFDLLNVLKKEKYDLVVTHDYGLMLNGLSAFFATKIFGVSQISEIHHLEGFPTATNMRELFYRCWGKIYLRVFVRRMRAVRIVSHSEIFSLLTEMKIPGKKILNLAAIYLDFSIYRPENLNKNLNLLFVGRFAQNKGIFTILNAIKILNEQELKLRIHLQGRGPLEGQIRSFVNNNNLSDLVSINTEFKSELELAKLYNQAQLLICASSVEGGPRVTLEAMACNTPVITTRCGIMPEVIRHRENGLFFDGSVGDLCQQLKSFFTEETHIPENPRDSVLKFDAPVIIAEYGQAYLHLMAMTS